MRHMPGPVGRAKPKELEIPRAPALLPATPGTKRTRPQAVGCCWVRTPSDWSDRAQGNPSEQRNPRATQEAENRPGASRCQNQAAAYY